MRNYDKKNMRSSTIHRNDLILEIYHNVVAELGAYATLVPKGYIYEKIHDRTGYCVRKIEDVINHYHS